MAARSSLTADGVVSIIVGSVVGVDDGGDVIAAAEGNVVVVAGKIISSSISTSFWFNGLDET